MVTLPLHAGWGGRHRQKEPCSGTPGTEIMSPPFVSLLQLDLPGNTLTGTPGFFLTWFKVPEADKIGPDSLYIYIQTPVMLTVAHDSREREVV